MLNVLSGYTTANIKSYEFKAGVQLEPGDWVVFDTDGTLIKQTGAYDIAQGATFPVYQNNVTAYDNRVLGRVDVVTANSGVLETDKFAAVSFTPGKALTIKDGVLNLAADSAPVIGFVVKYDAAKKLVQFVLN
jgi:hypothetical protein